jgi:CHAT domain-containing protein/tetratricopeptide (TPR) repeat protein
MSAFIESNDHLKEWLADDLPPDLLLTPLPDDVAREVVDLFIKEFERYWYTNMNRSLKYAERIIAIGRARNDTSQIASGMMRRADCIASLGSMEEAWDLYEQAGLMFQTAGDEVGWGRTRVGRLYLGPKLNRIPTTLAEADQAREIFTRYGEQDRLLRLDWQTGLMYNYVGEQHRALELLVGALTMAESLGEAGKPHIGPLYATIGLTYYALGDFYEALTYYNRALELAIAHNETLIIAGLEASIAEIAQAQGQYLRALTLLHEALEKVNVESPFKATAIKLHMVECYLALNRYVEAHDLARQLIRDFRMYNAADELALALLLLAMAEAALGNLDSAQTALEEAEPIFTSLNATTWVATIRLWRGRIALRRDDAESAYQESVAAATAFEADRQQVNDAIATLLQGQALFALNKFDSAANAGYKALGIGQCYNVPSLRYAAHLLLGHIAEARHVNVRAIRSYKAASATIERVQRGLTITLRSGFLEDKGEAMRALIALHLKLGNTGSAFETLERAKSQVWLGYLMNRESLRWAKDNNRSEALIEELNRLRAEHQWFYRLAHDPPKDTEIPNAVQPEHALIEVAVRERRMRAITEQLYMNNGGDQWTRHAPALSLKELPRTMDEGTILIEYYDDGKHLWAFLLNQQTITVHRLPLTTETLKQLISQLQSNLSAGLKVDLRTPSARNLTHLSRRILQRLHALLIEPLALQPHRQQRLVIVPYGALHFLPFHLLYDGSAYLIESYEVVILPTAGLAARKGPKRAPGALILTHTWDGRLPNTQAEAQIVQQLFGGRLCANEAANRSALQSPPTQILHIAAHGHHRLDQPDLSYLQLADGQLYADDVLQQDLSYELVTLSACETGRAKVAADEELIGIGRGFLYAGAGALLLSLWSVADISTAHLMERMYSALRAGASKAAALREAQITFLGENREMHPAFWGAFQLIGDAGPLSK